jgi:site-specific recombinase XerD
MIEDMTMRNLTQGTQRGYIRAVKRLAQYLGRSPDTATAEELRLFQKHLTDEAVAGGNINGIITALNFFFNMTVDQPGLTRKMHRVRVHRKLPIVLSTDEVKRLLEAAAKLRDKTALSIAYASGLRAAEVCALRVNDIDSSRMALRVNQGKGNKDRYALLSPTLLDLLRLYWTEAHAQHKLLKQGWLFPSRVKLTDHITTRQFNRILHQTADAAAIEKPVTLHLLRHSFATHLIEQDVDIRIIQVMLGHKKLETTARYTHVATRTLRSVTGPLEHLRLQLPT